MYMGLERSQCLYIGERVVYMGAKRVLLGEEAVHHVKRVYIALLRVRHVNGSLDGSAKALPHVNEVFDATQCLHGVPGIPPS